MSTTTLGLWYANRTEPIAGKDPGTETDIEKLAKQLDLLIPQPGFLQAWAARFAPSGWLLADGSAVSRTTYARLFAAICQPLGTVTVSIATPGVITSAGHWLVVGDAVYLTTTGALPTGLAANTRYYVVSATADTFTLSTTVGGAAINTSGTQSGVHTLVSCPYGLGNGSTTFNLPDLRGRVAPGLDGSAGRLAANDVLGQSGGAETHTLTTAEMPSHQHTTVNGGAMVPTATGGGSWGVVTATGGGAGTAPNSSTSVGNGDMTGYAGSGGAHNNMPPYQIVNWLIKT